MDVYADFANVTRDPEVLQLDAVYDSNTGGMRSRRIGSSWCSRPSGCTRSSEQAPRSDEGRIAPWANPVIWPPWHGGWGGRRVSCSSPWQRLAAGSCSGSKLGLIRSSDTSDGATDRLVGRSDRAPDGTTVDRPTVDVRRSTGRRSTPPRTCAPAPTRSQPAPGCRSARRRPQEPARTRAPPAAASTGRATVPGAVVATQPGQCAQHLLASTARRSSRPLSATVRGPVWSARRSPVRPTRA